MDLPEAADPQEHERGARMTSLREVKGEGCPEGIFYPVDESIPYQEWQAKALALAAAHWNVIGKRQVVLARKSKADCYFGQTHAIRTQARGYGLRRKHFKSTTECGQLLRQMQGWDCREGVLSETECLSCRKVVHEAYVRDLEYGAGDLADAGMDEYDRLQTEAMWEEQRRWHEMPDPSVDRPLLGTWLKLIAVKREVAAIRQTTTRLAAQTPAAARPALRMSATREESRSAR